MRKISFTVAMLLLSAGAVSAQQHDTTAKPDSAARSDSAARADSIRIVRELERIKNEPPKTSEQPPNLSTPGTGGGAGPTNPRLLPDISAVGDLVGDLSPKKSTQEDGSRFGVREVELAFQAAVDPYFRGDVFLGLSDLEKISIEEAYLTATALPGSFQARLGRFLMPVGKENATHRHDLHTIEYPWVIQSFLGGEGLKGTGLWVSKIFAPFGFYQELQLTAVDRFGDPTEGLFTEDPVNKQLSGLGYSARLRNYLDLSQSSNLELSASAVTGKREQAIACPSSPGGVCPQDGSGNTLGVPARQSVVGLDLTYRWRPLQQGLYKSLIVQGEVMRQLNDKNPSLPTVDDAPTTYVGPQVNATGGYLFARYQLTARLFLGGRYDHVEDAINNNATLTAGSGYFEFFPSEFSKLVAGYEHVTRDAAFTGAPDLGSGLHTDRILLQASFALGPHKPHPF